MHDYRVVSTGTPIEEAKKVLILIHGRGGSAEDILGLGRVLKVDGFALMAPQATGGAWYPYSFLAPPAQNEPWLSSAIANLERLVSEVEQQGIGVENIYFAGFSQGACLTLEFVTRNARRYGGVAAFTGGLIGDQLYPERYKGDFGGTPVFVGTGDPDPHVPVARVEASKALLEQMGAAVTLNVYKGRMHTISQDEIARANEVVF
ncbi:MAG: dienelactone hydrolase family protein [Candidatus Pseudobacter hemicellulosilyticus]|uniref:Dienelactone hydrolase family protein n=1 Tax=Candidatus Pseudobacter hemicellulosilyticus TaxID=3121375 RepID=A0AAJ5WV92_9BACT|nr:MAG: dienelactone hydrolase family protein [Pseudobacter sp.]